MQLDDYLRQHGFQRLDTWRTAQGWTQAQLANKIGVPSSNQVYAWERLRGRPSHQYALKLYALSGGVISPFSFWTDEEWTQVTGAKKHVVITAPSNRAGQRKGVRKAAPTKKATKKVATKKVAKKAAKKVARKRAPAVVESDFI